MTATRCDRFDDHILPPGFKWATAGCKHPTAEGLSRAEFRKLPRAECAVPHCKQCLGVICPDCGRVY